MAHQKPGWVENLLEGSSPGPQLETPAVQGGQCTYSTISIGQHIFVLSTLQQFPFRPSSSVTKLLIAKSVRTVGTGLTQLIHTKAKPFS